MAENTKTWNPLAENESGLSIPLKKKKPTIWFVNSMSDLFHEDVPFDYIDKVFAVMYECQQHTFQLLIKRAERMAEYFDATNRPRIIARAVWVRLYERDPEKASIVTPAAICSDIEDMWPFPNVWLGVSAEDQQRADERIPHLLNCPATVRFLSCEPLLGPIDLVPYLSGSSYQCSCGYHRTQAELVCGDFGYSCAECGESCRPGPILDWVIAGGESGPGARLCDIDWIRSIVKQCRDASVSVFVKQDSGSKPRLQGRIPDDIWNFKEIPNAAGL